MAAIAGILSVASGVLGAIGQQRQAEAQAQAAEFQAKTLEQRARSEREAAAAEAQDFRRQGSRARAASIARTGGSGVEADTGSPLLVDEAFVKDVALGSSRIRHGGEVRGTRLDQQAGLSRSQAGFARQAGGIQAGTSLLSGFRPLLSGQSQFG